MGPMGHSAISEGYDHIGPFQLGAVHCRQNHCGPEWVGQLDSGILAWAQQAILQFQKDVTRGTYGPIQLGAVHCW
jgi:hypothetical protein